MRAAGVTHSSPEAQGLGLRASLCEGGWDLGRGAGAADPSLTSAPD